MNSMESLENVAVKHTDVIHDVGIKFFKQKEALTSINRA